MRTRFLLGATAMLAWQLAATPTARAVVAQWAPEEGLHHGKVVDMQLPLQRVVPTEEMRTRWASLPHWSFSGFDQQRFGFDAVDVMADQHDFDCGSGHASLDLILVLRAGDGVTYWRLTEATDPARLTDSRPCEDEPDRWSVVGKEGAISVGLAAPDPRLPILRVAYGASWPMHTGFQDMHQQLIIDARRRPPSTPARLESDVADGFCLHLPEQPEAACRWNAGQSDFLCTETYAGGKRYRWLISGESLRDAPGSTNPPDLATFAGRLLKKADAVGQWAEPQDVGAVRLIADVRSTRPGRRILLFGASPAFGQPFMIAVRDGTNTVVVPVPADTAAAGQESGGSIPGPPFRVSGDPPTFTVRTLGRNAKGMTLLQVVAESVFFRTLYHVAIEETPAQVVADFIHVTDTLQDARDAFAALENDDPDACDSDEGGFRAPVKVRLMPLRIDYDIEPTFKVREDGPMRNTDEPCVVSARATWIPGKGFTWTDATAACRTDRFRAAYVRPDGSLEIRTRIRR